MTGKLKLIIILILFAADLFHALYAEDRQIIRIHGTDSAVDVQDLIVPNSGSLTENDLRRICAAITDRYHERGYTAFYIKKAALNKDGTADIYFADFSVGEVKVSGTEDRNDDIAASIYTKGELFNELILKDNIIITKQKYNLKRLNVIISRREGDDIVLTASVTEKSIEAETYIQGSPVYGVIPALTLKLNYYGFAAGITAASSFNQYDRNFNSGSIFFNSDSIPGNSYYTVSVRVSDQKDSYEITGQDLYRQRTFMPETGFRTFNGPASFGIYARGTYHKLRNYPGEDEGFSFSGLRLNLNYNDSDLKLGQENITAAEVDLTAGWNGIEHSFSAGLNAGYKLNFPVISRVFLSLNGNFYYVSDRERFLSNYVYDSLLPCRSGDYALSTWKNIAGLDLVFEVLRNTLYIAPVIKWGLHNSPDTENNITAAGFKLVYTGSRVKLEGSYLYNTDDRPGDGVMVFSAAAVY